MMIQGASRRMLCPAAVLLLVVPISSFHQAACGRLISCRSSFAFRASRFFLSSSSDSVPSIEQLESDDFIKQVGYSKRIVDLLQEDSKEGNIDQLSKRLRAQLSHADGIRGFMVTYLTTESKSVATPPALVNAILDEIDVDNDRNDLVALMCMNVIMPTAMVTMHEKEELSNQSAVTASRATELIRKILEKANDPVRQVVTKECESILTVAQEVIPENDESSLQYWTEFFEKWGYKDTQRADIANVMRAVLSA